MSKSVSIAIAAKDNFSTAITTMRNSSQAFGQDLQGLQNRLDALNRTRATLKVDVEKAKAALKEAEKQFAATGDAADKLALELANAEYENARRNLDLVSKNARQAEKDILSLTGAISKLDNRASGGGSEGMSILSSLASAGATKLIGDTISDLANAYVSSAFGNEVGAYFSSALSGAATGAAIGSVIPGIGTAIGAIGGALIGAVQGAIQVFEKQDEAFKQYYSDQYQTISEQTASTLESGTTIAATREQSLIAFSTLLGGRSNAQEYLNEMIRFAAETPFGYDTLADISRTLLAYGYKQDELLPLLTKVGDAGSALGMSNDDMVRIATALGRMQVTGKTTLEYLNPLLERGIPVWDYLAKASGKTKEEVQEMVSKGLVPGAEAAKAIADYMGTEFAGSMAMQSQTYAGLLSSLEDATESLNNAMGEGYTSERKSGIQAQIDYLDGEAGAALQEAYRIIGEGMAALENEKERLQREIMTSVVTGKIQEGVLGLDSEGRVRELMDAYKYAELALYDATKFGNERAANEARIRMKSLLEEAAAIAENEFNSSEIQQAYVDSQLELANSLKDNAALNDAYWDYGYRMGQQFSKGFGQAWASTSGESIYQTDATEGMSDEAARAWHYGPGFAYGVQRVPYDNYPAVLHEGERVLTASEARAYASGRGAAPVMITGNTFIVREEADIDRVASELARRLERAQMLAQ